MSRSSVRALTAAATATAAALFLAATPAAHATPLDFTLFNVSGGTQSRLALSASAQFAGAALTAAPQAAPGGLNGLGSLTTLYNDTGNGSRLATDLTQGTVNFLDTQGAIARNTVGSLGNNLAVAPNVGGTSGTAPASYGVLFTSPQSIAIPPIDLTPFGLTGTLNLGTLTSLDTKVALRGVVVDVTGMAPLSAYSANPLQSFDASLLQIALAGTADVLVGATVRQDSVGDYIAAGLALTALQQTLAPQGVALTIQNNGFVARSYTIGLGLSTDLPAGLAPNLATGAGVVEQIGSNLRLTLPLSFAFTASTPVDFLFSSQYALEGTLVGQVPFVVVEVPEPAAAWLALAGLALVAARVRRRAGSARG